MITHPDIKINLGLNVLRKRPDGYHDLETLFYPDNSFNDTLEIITGDDYSTTSARLFSLYGGNSLVFDGLAPAEEREEDELPTLVQGISPDGKLMITIAREEGIGWNPLKDMCAKAYSLLDQDFNLPNVKIYLEKKSPVGAGLGGGSADGAFALKMLNEMFSLGLDEDQLAAYASRIGSDCAFFIYNRPMIGEGRGEILQPFDLNLDGYEIQIIFPGDLSISTAEAYSKIHLSEDFIPIREVLALPVEEWKDKLQNSFEASIFASHPELAAIKQSLYDSGAVYAAMSGSGSALFGIYKA